MPPPQEFAMRFVLVTLLLAADALDDTYESANPSVRNWSVGVDRADGTVSLDPIPEKAPRK